MSLSEELRFAFRRSPGHGLLKYAVEAVPGSIYLSVLGIPYYYSIVIKISIDAGQYVNL